MKLDTRKRKSPRQKVPTNINKEDDYKIIDSKLKTKTNARNNGNTIFKDGKLTVLNNKTGEIQELDYESSQTKINDKKESGITTIMAGQKTVYVEENGKLVPMSVNVISKKTKHNFKGGWRRVFIEDLMEIVTGLISSSRKLDIIEYIIDNLDTNNKFTHTQAEVVKKLKSNPRTVNETFKYLCNNGFMSKKGTAYIVCSEVIAAIGSDAKNNRIMIEYNEGLEEMKEKEQIRTNKNKKEKGLFDEQGYYESEAKDEQSAKNQVS